MDLSIIIVNWNSANFTRECVASIRAETRGLEYEIIVVDNASTDDSLKVLETLDIRLIRNAENLGFAHANNLGAVQSTGSVLLFLNPDTELVGPAIDRMYSTLMASPEFGALGCKLLNTDKTLQTTCIQSFPTIWNQLLDVEQLKMIFPRSRMFGIRPLFENTGGAPAVVEALCGACVMIRREVFDRIGQFTTEYFMYGEDIDLCYQTRQAGLKVGYDSEAVIVHHGGGSSKKKADTGFGDIATREAVCKFLRKTRGPFYAQTYRSAIALSALIRLIVLGVALLTPLPRRDREYLRIVFNKWRRILNWSLGFEKWVKRLGPVRHHRTGEI
jgi:GT2 family glycosyltransferase